MDRRRVGNKNELRDPINGASGTQARDLQGDLDGEGPCALMPGLRLALAQLAVGLHGPYLFRDFHDPCLHDP